MIAFAKRNLAIYLRDKSAVFFSLLGVFITIGLYLLFLGDVWVSNFEGYDGAREMMDNWEMAGILAVTSVTSTLGMLATMVRDKSDKDMLIRDFYVAPVKRKSLTMGYFLSAYVVGVSMSVLAFLGTEVYFLIAKGSVLPLLTIMKILGVIVLTALSNSTMMLLLVSFFHSMNAFSTASTIVGTLISFITGIYLPIGMYPKFVQGIIQCFPTSHAAVLFRQLMMQVKMDQVLEGAPADTILDVKKELGVVFTYGNQVLPSYASLLVLLGSSVIFFLLANINLSKKIKS